MKLVLRDLHRELRKHPDAVFRIDANTAWSADQTLAYHVDMGGAVLIARDIATGMRLDKGRAVFPDVKGNGVQLLDA